MGFLVQDVLELDLAHYVPLCIGAFEETEEPYGFLASEACVELFYAGGPAHRCVVLAPLIQPPLKAMLRSPDPNAAQRALLCLHAFATCDTRARGGMGVCCRALTIKAVAAAVDNARRNHPHLGDYATTVLQVLEKHGGEDALSLIKQGVRTYVSYEFGMQFD